MTRYEAMEEYERDVRPYLHEIEHHAKMIGVAVKSLRFRPAFLTSAQAEMLATEQTLMRALDGLREVQEQYGAKHVEAERMQAADAI